LDSNQGKEERRRSPQTLKRTSQKCTGKGIERGGMRKGKMPIPRVKWFDDLFSMDVISKVVEDPFMCF
jgi:hypothetical protein